MPAAYHVAIVCATPRHAARTPVAVIQYTYRELQQTLDSDELAQFMLKGVVVVNGFKYVDVARAATAFNPGE